MDVSDTSSLLEPLVHEDRDESIRLELSEEKNGSCPLGHSNRDVIIHSNPNCIAITHKDGHLHQVCDAHNEVRPTSSDDNPSHCFLCYAAPPDTANDEVRSIIHVQAICCAAEIPAIRSILDKINGVENVAVVTTTKLVYVTHVPHKVAANDLIAALNEQMFEATLRQDGAHDKGESRIKPNITSKYVESTFMISSLIDTRDMDNIKRLLSREYLKDDLAQVDAHVPSKTVKIIHDPHKLSATTLQEFIRKSGYDVEILADGLAEGIWSSAYENGIKEVHAKLEWNIFLSGVFWGVSMLHLIDSEGKWKYMQYFALLSVVLVPKIALKAIMALRRWQFDTNCMMMFAIVGALALQEFSEAAAVSFFYSISDWLESISTSRARNALSHIANLRPDIAQVRDPVSGKFIFVPASEVPVGSIVTVRTGDKIPCDGIIVKGMSVVDESSLSGESRPVHKIPGNEVSGGTINSGLSQLSIKTTSTADDSAVARLVHLVEDAQSNTSPTEQLIDKFAPKYTLVMVLAAISMCTFPWIAGKELLVNVLCFCFRKPFSYNWSLFFW